MTNEQAIAVLKCLIGYYNDEDQDSYVGFDNEDNEALIMAIEALVAIQEADVELSESCVYDEHTVKAQQILRGVGKYDK